MRTPAPTTTGRIPVASSSIPFRQPRRRARPGSAGRQWASRESVAMAPKPSVTECSMIQGESSSARRLPKARRPARNRGRTSSEDGSPARPSRPRPMTGSQASKAHPTRIAQETAALGHGAVLARVARRLASGVVGSGEGPPSALAAPRVARLNPATISASVATRGKVSERVTPATSSNPRVRRSPRTSGAPGSARVNASTVPNAARVAPRTNGQDTARQVPISPRAGKAGRGLPVGVQAVQRPDQREDHESHALDQGTPDPREPRPCPERERIGEPEHTQGKVGRGDRPPGPWPARRGTAGPRTSIAPAHDSWAGRGPRNRRPRRPPRSSYSRIRSRPADRRA